MSNRTTEDYVTLVPLDPFYNVRFEDGSVFHHNGDRDYRLEQYTPEEFTEAPVEPTVLFFSFLYN